MKLIEADKVKRAMKDYWKAQVDKALTLIDGNEANNRINSYLEHNHELLKAIDELPSVQPNTTTHDSIPAETGKNDGDRTSGDCISRRQAIDALRGYLVEKRCPDDGTLTCRLIENEVINKLPSIQPERKTGHWVEIGDEPYDEWECDACGFVIDGSGCIDPEKYRDVYRFCPNCGAKMDGGEEHETD